MKMIKLVDFRLFIKNKVTPLSFGFVIIIVITLLTVMILPVKYKSISTFAFLEEKENIPKGLGQLGKLSGLDMLGSSEAILSPNSFEKVVKSYDFLYELINKPVIYSNESNHLIKNVILAQEGMQDINIVKPLDSSMLFLNKVDLVVISVIIDNLELTVDEKDGLITIGYINEDPYFAAAMVKACVLQLQNFLVELKIGQIKNNLYEIDAKLNTAEYKYLKSRKQYYNFLESNTNLASKKAEVYMENFEQSYNLNLEIYSNLINKKTSIELELLNSTPVFIAIQKPFVPIKYFKPNKPLFGVILFCLLFFVFIAILFINYFSVKTVFGL